MAIGVGLAFETECRAEPTPWFADRGSNEWLHHYDPTLISPRLLTELSYEDGGSGTSLTKLETTLRWAWSLSDGLGFGMQMKVPYGWNGTGTTTASGFGDLELRTGIVGQGASDWRYGFGLNAVFDTATDPALSDNAFILRPIAAVRRDLGDRVNLGANLEYNFTPRSEGQDVVSALELKLPVACKFTDHWSGAANYKIRWDLLDESDRHRLELVTTYGWGGDHRCAAFLKGELPLSSQNLDWKLTSGFIWYL